MIVLMKKSLKVAEANYKKQFHQHVPTTVQFLQGQYLYVYRTSKATLYGAEHLAEAPRTTLLSKAVGPFRLLAATPDTFTIHEAASETPSPSTTSPSPQQLNNLNSHGVVS